VRRQQRPLSLAQAKPIFFVLPCANYICALHKISFHLSWLSGLELRSAMISLTWINEIYLPNPERQQKKAAL
jgi:hypothetical protein